MQNAFMLGYLWLVHVLITMPLTGDSLVCRDLIPLETTGAI